MGHVEAYIPLPGDDRDAARLAARAGFDAIALAYDRARPGYPDSLFADLGVAGRVLEIGCGTGQATGPLAAAATEVVAVDLGPAMVEVARAKHPDVTFLVGAFEDVDVEAAGFDLVFSGTAFHWIDPAVAYGRVAEVLRPGGRLALATNGHVLGGTEADIFDEMEALHARLAPELGGWRFSTAEEFAAKAHGGGTIAEVWHRVERKFHETPDVSGLFEPPTVWTYERTCTYDRAGYIDLMGTMSPYLGLEPAVAAELLAGMGALVDERLGGSITKAFVTVLAVARAVHSPATPE